MINLWWIVVAGKWCLDTAILTAIFTKEHPGRAAYLAAFTATSFALTVLDAIVGTLLILAAGFVWWGVHRSSWRKWVGRWARPAWRRWWVYERRWKTAMRQCWLSIPIPEAIDAFPPIEKVICGPFGDVLLVRMLIGQTLDDWEDKATAIGTAFGAQHSRVFPRYTERGRLRVGRVERADGETHFGIGRHPGGKRVPGVVQIELAMKDTLSEPVPSLPIPASTADVDLEAVPIGVTENGKPWLLKLLGSHVLIAGLTGSGKGSVVWSILKGVAPAIRAGLVQAWGLDPKGGMELGFGRALFSRYADRNLKQMAALLADAVREMDDRTHRLAGVTRKHVPTIDEPLILIVIDEFASLLKSKVDAKTAANIAASIELLVNKGRAVGVCVIGALQNPRKEVVDMRDEFPDRIAMRLLSPTYSDMMFGPGSAASGIRCDRILRSMPGTGFAWSDDARAVIRVRAAFVDDDEVRALARDYQPKLGTFDEVLDDVEKSAPAV